MQSAVNYNSTIFNLIDSQVASIPINGCVVDFGSGLFTFAQKFREHGRDVVCIEIDQSLAELGKEANFKVLDSIEHLSSSIDFLYAVNVLEHIENDLDCLKLVFKSLETGGRAFIFVPAFQFLYTEMDRRVGHFRRYNHAVLSQRLNQTGFVIERFEYFDQIGFFATFIAKILGSKLNLSQNSVELFDRCLFKLNKFFPSFCRRFFGKNIWIIARKES